VRKAIIVIAVAVMGTGCGVAAAPNPDLGAAAPIVLQPSAAPFSQVTAGPVHALVPDGWHAIPAYAVDDLRGGFVAAPRPRAWGHMDGTTSGMAVTWIDATRVGVPSDFYYLAANGPLLSQLDDSPECRADRERVLIDDRPSFAEGARTSPGDYMASAEGTCRARGHLTRWAYFVAAPGFGPVRRIGIPSSGLYVVVAVMPAAIGTAATLRRLIAHTSFAGATVPDFMAMAHAKPAT
jgi:hypothetical protein